MKKKKFLVIFWIAVSVPGTFPIYGEFATGTIIEKVVCQANPQQSYALYLPPGYPGDKKWPIIYALDAGARGALPLHHFKPAAKKYGYIIVGSNNARNGPGEPIAQAVRAMWLDTQNRFSIDNNRVYTTGFSGGARMASIFKYIVNQPVTGIIGCGAGLNTNLKPGMIKPEIYYGIVGLSDFNYREMMKLDNDFDTAGVVHRVLVFDGDHRWPPEEYCLQAVEWMEINAIKKGLKEKNEPLVADLYKKALDRAKHLEQSKNIFLAVSAYEAGEQLFSGLPDVNEFKNKRLRLKNSKEFKQFQKEEKRRNKKESEFIRIFIRVTVMLKNTIPSGLPRLETVLRDLKIRYLQKEANKTGKSANKYDAALAQRLLTDLRVKVSREGSAYLQKGDFHRAAIFFNIAVRAGNEHPNLIYNLACVYSLARNRKKGLDYLRRAVKKGFNDLDLIKKDKDLDFIRNEKEFKEIIREINDN
jgi:tetratricopeptide (TPR) repeat protein